MSRLGDSFRRRGRPGGGRGDTASDEDRAYLDQLHDTSVPLPAGAESELRRDNPRLVELRRAYAELDLPVSTPSRWASEAVESFLDLRFFRGETLFYWHYRESIRLTRLKYFVYMSYVRERDRHDWLGALGEDGGFGCWTFDYEGHGRFSRDLLESVNEIAFLERQLGLSGLPRYAVLDIGAGYGRLATRMCASHPAIDDYCCVDAIAEATFVCEYYLRHRGTAPPARVARLDRLAEELRPGAFELAVNVHSFSELPLAAVAWWIEKLERLEVPNLFIVPNEPEELLSTEPDGTRSDFAPLLAEAGYRLEHREPAIADPAVRELVGVEDRFHLFRRSSR